MALVSCIFGNGGGAVRTCAATSVFSEVDATVPFSALVPLAATFSESRQRCCGSW